MISAVHHARSTFGPYVGVYLGMIATHQGKPVLHRLSGMKNAFSGTAAGREVFGMPLETGEPTMEWHGDALNIVARRQGKDFARVAVRLERRVDAPTSRFKDSTSVVRRSIWDAGEKRNVLLGTMSVPADPKDLVYWTGSAVVTLIGGDPGDDWSILPMYEVLDTIYNVGGYGNLTGPRVLEEF